MRDREILAIAQSKGLYDRKVEFVEISPEELISFARNIEHRAYEEVKYKIQMALEKL